ncbi:MAG: Calx-beta domain-containing protein [Vicinamibacteria bacterium]
MKPRALASLLVLAAAVPSRADLGPLSVARLGMTSLTDSATGAGVSVVVGDGGEIWSSADTVSWTQRVGGAPGHRLSAVTFGGGRFVAVGTGPAGARALVSDDGGAWTPVALPSAPLDVAHGADQFVAVAGNRVLRSPDGLQWTAASLPSSWSVLSVAYGGGQFVAVGFDRRLLTSPDAVTWTDRSANVPAAMSFLAGVTWSGQRYVVVGQGGIVVSTDGVAWQRVSTISYDAVAAGAAGVVAVNFSSYAWSPTGESWTTSVFPFVSGVAPGAVEVSGSSGFVTVGVAGSLRTSADGLSWTNRTLPASRWLRAVAHDGTRFCAAGSYSGGASSLDGVTWTNTPGPGGDTYALLSTGARFVSAGVAGNQARIAFSTDCATWTFPPWTPPPSSFFEDIGQGAGRLVAVGSRFAVTGEEPIVATSSDEGSSWTAVSSGLGAFPGALWSVAHGNGLWVAAGRRVDVGPPPLTTSPDGVTWTGAAGTGLESGTTVSGLAYGAGLFVAAGSGIWTSTDGSTWTRRVPPVDTYSAVSYSAGRFVAVGGAGSGQGVVAVSPDGIDWTVVERPSRNLRAVAFAQAPALDRLAIVGDSIVLQAPGYVPVLTLEAPAVPEAAQQATVTLRLSAPAVDPVTLAYFTSDLTAAAGLDYTAIAGTVTFAPGTSERTLQTPVAVDGLEEGDETFRLSIGPVAGASVPAGHADVTIVDTPTIVADDAATPEGNTGASPAGLAVRLSHPSAQPVTVAYATGGGTAIAGVDYTAAAGTLTFAPGTATLPVPANVLGDTAIEPDETFGLSLSSPTGASLVDASADAVIQDDDAPPLAQREIAHGMTVRDDFGDPAGADTYRLAQASRASYELVVDAVAGDVLPLVIERLAADNATVLDAGLPTGTGAAVSLRWANGAAGTVANQHLRVRAACAAACTLDDVYRLRAYETTLRAPRFSNVGGQVTLLVLQNPSPSSVAGTAYFWAADGSLLQAQAVALAPRQTLVLNAAGLAGLNGRSGSITVAHSAPYGVLAGKAVALEPATGFGFDTPLAPRPR